MKQNAPDVLIIKALKPEQSSTKDDKLRYTNLSSAALRHSKYDSLRWSEFLSSPESSIVEEKKAEHLALQYLLQTSEKLNNSKEDDSIQAWSERFTNSSIELFGEPNSENAKRLLIKDRNQIIDAALKSNQAYSVELREYLDILEALGINKESKNYQTEESKIKENRVTGFFKTQLHNRYSGVIETLEDPGIPDLLTPQDIKKYMSIALDKLISDDSRWAGWAVEIADGANISRTGNSIKVGRDRVSMHKKELKGIFAHEVLVHGARSVNGSERSEMLKKGLTGYLSSEEGIATLAEYAMSGEIPQKIVDRYTDIALALGKIKNKKFTRQELSDFVIKREKVRTLLGKEDYGSDDELDKKCAQHVARIYRGSQGNNYIGVFTKDYIYYEGFDKMLDYISEEIEKSVNENDLYDFLMQGKFDPLNETHVSYIMSE